MASILAIVGLPGSGKALVANRLCNDFGYRRLRFSDPLRDMLKAGFNVEVETPEGRPLTQPVDHMNDYRPFHLVQKLGDFLRRNVSGDVLIDEWRRRADAMGGDIVVDNLYDQTEADAVRKAGGVVVRVTRPGFQSRQDEKFERRVLSIQHDVELINNSPDELAAMTDVLAAEVRAICGRG